MYFAEIKFIFKKKPIIKDIFKYIIGIKCKPKIKSYITYNIILIPFFDVII